MQRYSNEYLEDLNSRFNEIIRTNKNLITAANLIVEILEAQIKELHQLLMNYKFSSLDDEIYFFKFLKPKLIAKLIYYTKIIDLESNLPTPKKPRIKYLQKELNRISQYTEKNKYFNQYYRSNSNHKDQQYFSRTRGKKFSYYECQIINYDIRLSSPYDYTAAKIIANDLLVTYIESKIEQCKTNSNAEKTPSLNWTGNKIDLIELIYALHKQKVINDGNIDIKDFAIVMGKIFDLELEDTVYRSYIDIKNRKDNRTKFLTTLAKTLNNKIDEE